MSNYITIESGHFLPFKENETDPALKIWADKYFEIIKKIQEVLSPYNNRFEHSRELVDRIKKLEEQIRTFNAAHRGLLSYKENQKRELLLQSSFKDEMNSLLENKEIGFFNSPVYNNEDKQDLLWRFQHISDFFSCANKYKEQHFSEKSIRSLAVSAVDDLFELKEELRKCLLHRVWKSNHSVLINESNIVSVEFDDKNGNLLFGTCSPLKINVYPFVNYDDYKRRDLVNVWYAAGNREELFNKYDLFRRKEYCNNTFEMTYSIINDIKSNEEAPLSVHFLYYVVEEFIKVSSMCSNIETYKDFQSGNIDKIKKDKIRCGQFNFDNANEGIRVYT